MIVKEKVVFSLSEYLKPKDYPETEDYIAGVKTKLASFSREECQALIDMLDKMYYYNAYYSIKQTIIEDFDLIVNLIRSVKTETKQPFQGVYAKGNGLTLKRLDVNDFGYVWGTNTNKTWKMTVTAGNAYEYIGTSSNPEQTAEEEGIIILGFMEKSPVPKIDQVQLKKNGEDYIPQFLEWDAVEDEPFVPLPEPYVMLPETNFQLKVHASVDGETEFVPVGFKILQAKKVPSLFT